MFASHSPSQRRVEANIAKAKELPKGQQYNKRYQAAIAQLNKDSRAYIAEPEALAALNKKQEKEALVALDKAVALQPRESSF